METYFKLRTWIDFYIPLIFVIAFVVGLVILFGVIKLSNIITKIKHSVSDLPSIKAKRVSKQRAALEKKGYEEILIDDVAYLVPYEIAHDEDSYVPSHEISKFFKISELASGSYTWDQINAAKDSQK